MLSTGTSFLPHTVKTLTDHSTLPFEVVGCPKVCKLNNNIRDCPKPRCLNDINGNINIRDGVKGPKENSGSIRGSIPATSLWMTNSTASFIVSSPKSTGES